LFAGLEHAGGWSITYRPTEIAVPLYDRRRTINRVAECLN
jgi:hypothetical protein